MSTEAALVDVEDEMLLRKFDPKASRHITTKIVNPRGGEVYIFYNDTKPQDWECDSYTWYHDGAKKLFPAEHSVICKSYWQVKDENKKKSNAWP
jgi:hypothetical protein